MSFSKLPKKITRDMVFKLRYDKISKSGTPVNYDDLPQWNKPTCLIVFDDADINSSAYLVAQSAQMPFEPNTIACIFVQESIRETFLEKVRGQFKPLEGSVTQHVNFKRTMDIIKRLNATTIKAKEDDVSPESSPTLVCNYPQSYFGYGPSGVITLNTFRTAKEVSGLCAKESLTFDSVSIWTENFSCSYELAMNLPSPIFYFNCRNVSLEPIQTHFDTGMNNSIMFQAYHYESIVLEEKKMIIVFAIGTMFD